MPHPPEPRKRTSKYAVALLLTFGAGLVDIVGYITLFGIFTAHMTGNTVHLAENVVHFKLGNALTAGVAVAAFLLGSIVGRVIIEVGDRKHIRSIASICLLLEAALILAFVGLTIHPLRPTGSPAQNADLVLIGVSLLAAAMGAQTATLTRIGALTVHTTFVTGMLNKFAQLASHTLFESVPKGGESDGERRERVARRGRKARQATFIFAIWLCYLAGAVCGTCLDASWGTHSLFITVGILGLAIIVDQLRPLSVEEEHDQTER